MEMIKKFGLWALAAAIAIAAIVVYFLFVYTVAEQVSAKRGDIAKRRDDLKGWAEKGSEIPNPTKIEITRKRGEQIAAELDQCELYLARQPRRAHTIRFFTEGPLGPEVEVPLDRPNDWLDLYDQNNKELQNQLTEAGMAYTVSRMDSDWGSSPPTPDQIAEAMELYWFQKDLIDFLTQQVEKDFAAYLEFKARDRADAFPAKPFDLVVNRKPARLDEFLRAISREKLVAVLGAIVVNRQQQDLAVIFNTLLSDEKKPDGTIEYGFPWERPVSDKEHASVRGLTMDDAQEKFLADMLPPGKPDLSDRQRFLDYVMELRMVRYRADVIGLLESHHFDSLAASLRRGTEPELNGILSDIADVNGSWNTTRIAEAISAIISINNEKDFLLVRNNHAPNIAALLNMTISAPNETNTGSPMRGPGGPGLRSGRLPTPVTGIGAGASRRQLGNTAEEASAAPGSDLYKLRTFDMQVKLEFDRIPVFLRRLISNSWRYNIQIVEITPSETTTGAGYSTTSPLQGMGGRMGHPGMASGGDMGMGGRMGHPGMAPGGGMVMGGRPPIPGMRPTPGMSSRGGMPSLPGSPEEYENMLNPRRAAGRGAPSAKGPEAETVEAGNYVILRLTGEAYQFAPLVTKYMDKLENRATPAAPAPPGKPAAPTGAR